MVLLQLPVLKILAQGYYYLAVAHLLQHHQALGADQLLLLVVHDAATYDEKKLRVVDEANATTSMHDVEEELRPVEMAWT